MKNTLGKLLGLCGGLLPLLLQLLREQRDRF